MAEQIIHSPPSPLVKSPRRNWLLRLILYLLGGVAGAIRFLLYMSIFFGLLVLLCYTIMGRFVGGEEVLAPDLKGQSVMAALEVLRADKITLSLERTQPHESVAKGHVIRQFPPAGSRIKAGTPIEVVVSIGHALITVPDLRGQNKIAAGIRLRRLGLEVGNMSALPDPKAPGGSILTTDPPPGAGVIQGAAVNLLISDSQAPTQQVMPNLIGLTSAQAGEVLAEYGLVVATAYAEYGEDSLSGQIHEQDPPAGWPIDASTRVTVYHEPGPYEEDDLVDPYDLPPLPSINFQTGGGPEGQTEHEEDSGLPPDPTPRPRLPELVR